MKYFQQIAQNIDVIPTALALARQPELWNAHHERRSVVGTSHLDTSDIWIRFNSLNNLDKPYKEFIGPHESVWHDAYYKLPQLRKIIFDVMARCEGVRLGGVLITKIPPGKAVLPHTDKGWHPEYYNTKIYIPILTNEFVINRCVDETVIMEQGSAWYFNNTVEHEVVNNGDSERITLIICLRCEG